MDTACECHRGLRHAITMQTTRPISVLNVAQDNFFEGLPSCTVDHVPTGTTITPQGAQPKRLSHRLPAILARICLGHYDLIVLPAIDFRWSYDLAFSKRVLRLICSTALRCKPISLGANSLLSRKSTKVIVLDRYDSHELLLDYVRCLKCVRYYFKTNLQYADQDGLANEPPIDQCRFLFLPYWIAIEKYQVPFQSERDFDVFFAGAVNSDQRRASLDMVQRLSSEGYRLKIVESHLPFEEYLWLMSRSWLTLSPQGYGYNGFRHYEAMLVGSLPLINRSDPPIVNDFRHGDNCFLYSMARGDLLDVIRSALTNKGRLLQMAVALRNQVIENHSIRAVGSYLLQQVLQEPNCCPVRDSRPRVDVVCKYHTTSQWNDAPIHRSPRGATKAHGYG